MFNSGVLTVYKKIPSGKSIGGKNIEVLEFYTSAFYGEINFKTSEYYAAMQSEIGIEKRIRILQNKTICSNHVVIINGNQYEVGRTDSGTEKGLLVSYITLERVTVKYDIG